jgi:heterotetrameric sarcosine oxidase delta subunit
MLRIRCSWCGERDHTEFTYGPDATVLRPRPDASDQDWVSYVYMRANPCGPHQEYWHHLYGCRQWLRVRRNTLTHEITDVSPALPCSGER